MSSTSAAIFPKRKSQIGVAVILGSSIASFMMYELLEVLLPHSEQPGRSVTYFVALSISYLFGGFFADTIAKETPLRYAALSGSIIVIYGVVGLLVLLIVALLPNGGPARTLFRELIPINVFQLTAPIPLFVLGAYLDRLICKYLVARNPRNQWNYVLSSGKAVQAFSPWQVPILGTMWLLLAFLIWATFWVPCYSGDCEEILPGSSRAVPRTHCVACFRYYRDGLSTTYTADPAISWFLFGFICYIAAKRRTAVSVDTLLAKDRRPPVIYLRPFGDDGKQMQGGLRYELSDSVRALRGKTIEQRLAKVFTKLGPFIAIGRPGELLPELGAARMYVDNEVWQEVVEDITSKAQLVVLQAGETQGLQWELRKVGDTISPERVLLFVPFPLKGRDREEAYSRFRAWAQTCFPGVLPERIGNAFFLYFESAPSWRANVVEGPASLFPNHPLHSTLVQLAQDKAFNRLGVGRVARHVRTLGIFGWCFRASI
jgi:hypothetical protein